MLDDFFVRAVVAGIGVAVVAGPLGCFVVWRRMAYFGATMAHSALMGVALGLLLDIGPQMGVMIVTLLIASLLVALQRNKLISNDTLLGFLAHGVLAVSLVVIALMTWVRLDLMGYLFGDILGVTAADVVWVYAGGTLVLGALALIWRPLLAITVHEDLARAEGVATGTIGFVFMLLIAVVIALAMKLIGALLIVSLLIMPAAAARPFVRTPEQMAVAAAAIGVAAVIIGLQASLRLDTPGGPSIVVVAAAFCAISMLPFFRSAGRE